MCADQKRMKNHLGEFRNGGTSSANHIHKLIHFIIVNQQEEASNNCIRFYLVKFHIHIFFFTV